MAFSRKFRGYSNVYVKDVYRLFGWVFADHLQAIYNDIHSVFRMTIWEFTLF